VVWSLHTKLKTLAVTTSHWKNVTLKVLGSNPDESAKLTTIFIISKPYLNIRFEWSEKFWNWWPSQSNESGFLTWWFVGWFVWWFVDLKTEGKISETRPSWPRGTCLDNCQILPEKNSQFFQFHSLPLKSKSQPVDKNSKINSFKYRFEPWLNEKQRPKQTSRSTMDRRSTLTFFQWH